MRACPCSSVLYVRRSGGCDSFPLPSARAVYDTGRWHGFLLLLVLVLSPWFSPPTVRLASRTCG